MMTRADMYDWLRRQLGIVPPVDDGTPGARPGDLPLARPQPTNPALRQAIDNAVWRINREAQLCRVDPTVQMPIPAQTAEGPYVFSLSDIPRRGVDRVIAAWWRHSNGAVRRLTPTSSAELERMGRLWASSSPSTPTHFWLEQYDVYIYPAPSTSGTLQLQVEQAILPPMMQNDTFSGIPEELETAVLYQALVDLSKVNLGDNEMMARARAFEPDAIEGMAAIKSWAARQTGRYQPRLTFRSYRTGRVIR